MSSANSFYQERLKDKFLEKAMKDATSDGTNGHTNGTSDPMNPLMLEAEMFAIKVRPCTVASSASSSSVLIIPLSR